jgi:hypothetical protein
VLKQIAGLVLETPQALMQSEGRWPRICARRQACQQSEVCHVF